MDLDEYADEFTPKLMALEPTVLQDCDSLDEYTEAIEEWFHIDPLLENVASKVSLTCENLETYDILDSNISELMVQFDLD